VAVSKLLTHSGSRRRRTRQQKNPTVKTVGLWWFRLWPGITLSLPRSLENRHHELRVAESRSVEVADERPSVAARLIEKRRQVTEAFGLREVEKLRSFCGFWLKRLPSNDDTLLHYYIRAGGRTSFVELPWASIV